HRFGTQQFLLILLLRLVVACVKRVQRPAAAIGAVGRSTMPQVSIHDDERSGLAGNQLFAGQGTRVTWLGQAAPGMRARNHARGAVLNREVVEHPQRVAHPVAVLVGDRSGVDVPRLRFSVVRVRRTGIETAQLERRANDVLHACENLRHRNEFGEDRALVDEVREASRAGLVSELRSGLAAFLLPQVLHALVQRNEHSWRNKAGQYEIAQLIELLSLGWLKHQTNSLRLVQRSRCSQLYSSDAKRLRAPKIPPWIPVPLRTGPSLRVPRISATGCARSATTAILAMPGSATRAPPRCT